MSVTTRNQKAIAALAAAGSVAAPMVLAAPASARHPGDTCPGNTICEWHDAGFNLPVRWDSPTSEELRYKTDDLRYSSDTSAKLNDSISAVWNNSSRWVKFYQNEDSKGKTFCFAPGGAVSDLSSINLPGGWPWETWNDRFSGHQTYAGQPSGCDTTKSDQGCSI